MPADAMDSLEDEVKVFFSSAKRMKGDLREEEFRRIKADYLRTLDDAEEKCNITSQMYDLVNRYLTRLDQELEKFKNELEADNAGITEILERRSHELDQPAHPQLPLPQPQHQHSNNIRKKYSLATGGGSGAGGLFSRDSTPDFARGLAPGGLNANGNASPALTLSSQSSQAGAAPLSLYSANNAIAAAASQAIVATQQMQSGRRTASLKASIDAISGLGTGLGGGFTGFAGDGFSGTLGTFGLEAGSSARANKRARSASQFQDSGTLLPPTLLRH